MSGCTNLVALDAVRLDQYARMTLFDDFQQLMQMLNLIDDWQPIRPGFVDRVVPTGVDAIVQASLHIGGEAVADDQYIILRGILRPGKGSLKEGGMRLGGANFL